MNGKLSAVEIGIVLRIIYRFEILTSGVHIKAHIFPSYSDRRDCGFVRGTLIFFAILFILRVNTFLETLGFFYQDVVILLMSSNIYFVTGKSTV